MNAQGFVNKNIKTQFHNLGFWCNLPFFYIRKQEDFKKNERALKNILKCFCFYH